MDLISIVFANPKQKNKSMKNPYHTVEIKKGIIGEASKIFEEVEEFRDAVLQNSPILQLCELADLIGAIEAYTESKFNISLDEIILMTKANKQAFVSGFRT
jgi:hypothetical protein